MVEEALSKTLSVLYRNFVEMGCGCSKNRIADVSEPSAEEVRRSSKNAPAVRPETDLNQVVRQKSDPMIDLRPETYMKQPEQNKMTEPIELQNDDLPKQEKTATEAEAPIISNVLEVTEIVDTSRDASCQLYSETKSLVQERPKIEAHSNKEVVISTNFTPIASSTSTKNVQNKLQDINTVFSSAEAALWEIYPAVSAPDEAAERAARNGAELAGDPISLWGTTLLHMAYRSARPAELATLLLPGTPIQLLHNFDAGGRTCALIAAQRLLQALHADVRRSARCNISDLIQCQHPANLQAVDKESAAVRALPGFIHIRPRCRTACELERALYELLKASGGGVGGATPSAFHIVQRIPFKRLYRSLSLTRSGEGTRATFAGVTLEEPVVLAALRDSSRRCRRSIRPAAVSCDGRAATLTFASAGRAAAFFECLERDLILQAQLAPKIAVSGASLETKLHSRGTAQSVVVSSRKGGQRTRRIDSAGAHKIGSISSVGSNRSKGGRINIGGTSVGGSGDGDGDGPINSDRGGPPSAWSVMRAILEEFASVWDICHSSAPLGQLERSLEDTVALYNQWGHDLNFGATDGLGRTGLHLAARQGNVALCRALLDAGSRPATTDSFGCTALHLACTSGCAETVLLLLAADPSAARVQDCRSRHPLQLLPFGRHTSVETMQAIERLARASELVLDREGGSAVHACVAWGTREELLCLASHLPGFDINGNSASNMDCKHRSRAPLLSAGRASTLRTAAQRPCGCDAVKATHPLEAAMHAGNVEVLNTVADSMLDAVDFGSDDLCRAIFGSSRYVPAALIRQAWGSWTARGLGCPMQISRQFVVAVASDTASNFAAYSADLLCSAAGNSNLDTVVALLDSRADANASEGSASPLLLACVCGDVPTVTLLLERGAAVDHLGLVTSIEEKARRSSARDFTRRLRSQGVIHSVSAVGLAAICCDMELVQHLMECKADCTKGARTANLTLTALHMILDRGLGKQSSKNGRLCCEVVAALATAGVGVCVDDAGVDTLSLAIRRGYTDVALKLIDADQPGMGRLHDGSLCKTRPLEEAALVGDGLVIAALLARLDGLCTPIRTVEATCLELCLRLGHWLGASAFVSYFWRQQPGLKEVVLDLLRAVRRGVDVSIRLGKRLETAGSLSNAAERRRREYLERQWAVPARDNLVELVAKVKDERSKQDKITLLCRRWPCLNDRCAACMVIRGGEATPRRGQEGVQQIKRRDARCVLGRSDVNLLFRELKPILSECSEEIGSEVFNCLTVEEVVLCILGGVHATLLQREETSSSLAIGSLARAEEVKWCCLSGDADAVEELLAHGADANCEFALPAEDMSATSDGIEEFQPLLTERLLAFCNGVRPATLKKKVAEVLKGLRTLSALGLAVCCGHRAVSEVLIRYGAKCSRVGSTLSGNRPLSGLHLLLQSACGLFKTLNGCKARAWSEMAESMAGVGVCVDDAGVDTLSLAIRRGYTEATLLHMKENVSYLSMDIDGILMSSKLLQDAVLFGDCSVISELLAHGAERTESPKSMSVLDSLVYSPWCIDNLLYRVMTPRCSLFLSARLGDLAMFESVWTQHPEFWEEWVQSECSRGMTVLMHALLGGNSNIVSKLVGYGDRAFKECKVKYGRNVFYKFMHPLIFAAEVVHDNCLLILLNHFSKEILFPNPDYDWLGCRDLLALAFWNGKYESAHILLKRKEFSAISNLLQDQRDSLIWHEISRFCVHVDIGTALMIETLSITEEWSASLKLRTRTPKPLHWKAAMASYLFGDSERTEVSRALMSLLLLNAYVDLEAAKCAISLIYRESPRIPAASEIISCAANFVQVDSIKTILSSLDAEALNSAMTDIKEYLRDASGVLIALMVSARPDQLPVPALAGCLWEAVCGGNDLDACLTLILILKSRDFASFTLPSVSGLIYEQKLVKALRTAHAENDSAEQVFINLAIMKQCKNAACFILLLAKDLYGQYEQEACYKIFLSIFIANIPGTLEQWVELSLPFREVASELLLAKIDFAKVSSLDSLMSALYPEYCRIETNINNDTFEFDVNVSDTETDESEVSKLLSELREIRREKKISIPNAADPTINVIDYEMESQAKSKFLAAVLENPSVLKDAPDDIKGDKDIVLASLKQSWQAFEYATDELKNDKFFVISAVSENWRTLKFAGDDIKADSAILATACIRYLELSSKVQVIQAVSMIMESGDDTLLQDAVLAVLREIGSPSRRVVSTFSIILQVIIQNAVPGDIELIQILCSQIQRRTYDQRAELINTLQALETEETRELLTQVALTSLGDCDSDVRVAAVQMLAKIGRRGDTAVFNQLRNLVSEKCKKLQCAAVRALGFIATSIPEEIRWILTQTLNDNSAHARLAALAALVELSKGRAREEAFEILFEVVGEDDIHFRPAAVESMLSAARNGTSDSVNIRSVIKRLESSNVLIRRASAAVCIVLLKSTDDAPDAEDALVQSAMDSDSAVRALILHALIRVVEPQRQGLIRQLEGMLNDFLTDRCWRVRQAGALLAGRLGTRKVDVISNLAKLLCDCNTDVVIAAALALKDIKVSSVDDKLVVSIFLNLKTTSMLATKFSTWRWAELDNLSQILFKKWAIGDLDPTQKAEIAADRDSFHVTSVTVPQLTELVCAECSCCSSRSESELKIAVRGSGRGRRSLVYLHTRRDRGGEPFSIIARGTANLCIDTEVMRQQIHASNSIIGEQTMRGSTQAGSYAGHSFGARVDAKAVSRASASKADSAPKAAKKNQFHSEDILKHSVDIASRDEVTAAHSTLGRESKQCLIRDFEKHYSTALLSPSLEAPTREFFEQFYKYFGSGELETWGLGSRAIGLLLDAATSHMPTVNLANNNLGSLGVSRIKAWPMSATIEKLVLTANGIDGRGATGLGELLRMGGLTFLDLDYNQIDDIGASQIASAMVNNSSLKYLSLNCNCVRDEGGVALAECFKFTKCLSHLGIAEHFFSENTTRAIAESAICAIETFRNLRTIRLSKHNLDIASLLETLSVQGLQLGGLDVQLVGQALKHCPCLLHLDLSNNKLGDVGITHVCSFLSDHKCIRTLRLHNVDMEDEGLHHLTLLISGNKLLPLREIDVSSNRFKDQGVLHHYAMALGSLQELIRLRVDSQVYLSTLGGTELHLEDLSPQDEVVIAGLIQSNLGLKKLNLSGIGWGSALKGPIACYLTKITVLEDFEWKLNVSDNSPTQWTLAEANSSVADDVKDLIGRQACRCMCVANRLSTLGIVADENINFGGGLSKKIDFLTSLDLHSCNLKLFPPAILMLSSLLQSLNISDNQELEEIPARELCSMKSLNSLECAGCPNLLMPPVEVAAQGGERSMQFLQEVMRSGRPNILMTLVFIGNGEAGKTSTIRALTSRNDKTVRIREQSRTVGINIIQWAAVTGQEGLSFTILDLAGQAIYATTHQVHIFFIENEVLLHPAQGFCVFARFIFNKCV